MNIPTKVCILLALAFVVSAPLAAADDPDPFTSGKDAEAGNKCIDVDIFNTPPVDVYDCPANDP
jgi:hypothetical protein